MHPYATESNERKTIPLFIAFASVGAAWVLFSVVNLTQFVFPWWADAPSVMGFYGLFYTIFDRYLWRNKLVMRIGLVKLPNLNGKWTGTVTSSFNKNSAKYSASLEITQTWTQIHVLMKTDGSESHSRIGSIITNNPGGAHLSYEYFNEPKGDAQKGMQMHRGTASLRLSSDGKMFDGIYYTGRGRQTHGSLNFKR